MKFNGFKSPNFTQAPNELFDTLLKEIDDLCELKVTMTMIRYTFGFHRETAELSQSFLVNATGMTEKSVKKGIKLAILRGTIRVEKAATARTGTIYGVVFQGESDVTPQDVAVRNKTVQINNSTEISKSEISVRDSRTGEVFPLVESKPPKKITGGAMERHVAIGHEFDEDKPKERVYYQKTELLEYLRANAHWGKTGQWEGFKRKSDLDEWLQMEKDYPREVIMEKMKWALSSRFPKGVIASRIITAVHNYGKPKSEQKPIEVVL